jgi:hypothetical protein
MVIKIDKVSNIKHLLYLVFLLDICFWFVFPIETSFTGVYNKKLITILIVALALYTVVLSKFFWKKSFRFLLIFSGLFLIDWIALTLYSKGAYPAQGLGGTLAMAYYYLGFFIVFPILYVILHDDDPESFLRTLNVFAIILIGLLLVQAVVYSLFGAVFLRGVLNTDNVTMRSGRIRIGMTLLGNISVIYNFSKIAEKKAEKIHYIGFVMGIICAFIVQMVRMYEFAIVGTLLVVYVASSKKSNRILRIIIVLFAIVYVTYMTGIVDSFISSFDVNGNLGAGTRVRFEAIEYFMTYVQKNPLFGMGFVHQNYYSSVLYGANGRYYLTDVGIIGLLTECGGAMVALYVLFCIRMVYIITKIKRQNKGFLVGLCVFTLLCTPTLIIWGRRSIIYIGLIMAIFEVFITKRDQ